MSRRYKILLRIPRNHFISLAVEIFSEENVFFTQLLPLSPLGASFPGRKQINLFFFFFFLTRILLPNHDTVTLSSALKSVKMERTKNMLQVWACTLQLCVMTHFISLMRTSESDPRPLLFNLNSLIYNSKAYTSSCLRCGYTTFISQGACGDVNS